MHTARSLTVSPSMHCAEGVCLVWGGLLPEGVPGPGGLLPGGPGPVASAPRGVPGPGGVCSQGVPGLGGLLSGGPGPGGSAPRGVPGRGGLLPWGCLVWGLPGQEGGGIPACTEANPPPLWTEFLTHASENVTLPFLWCVIVMVVMVTVGLLMLEPCVQAFVP